MGMTLKEQKFLNYIKKYHTKESAKYLIITLESEKEFWENYTIWQEAIIHWQQQLQTKLDWVYIEICAGFDIMI